jgi:hypothetical protein
MRYLLICLITLISLQAVAQGDYRPGYIITTTSDTIRGFILYKERSSQLASCTFRNSSNEATTYSPQQLAGYGIDNEGHFKSITYTVDNTVNQNFAEILIYGKATLLLANNDFFLETSEHEIFRLREIVEERMVDGKTYIRTKPEFKGILNLKFSDCNTATARIMRSALNEKSLINVFNHYNTCTGGVKNMSQKPWSRTQVGLAVNATGASTTDLTQTYNHIEPNQFSSTRFVAPGVTLILQFPRSSERLFFESGVFYIQEKFYSSKQTTSNTVDVAGLTSNYLQVPIGIGYYLNNSKQLPLFIEGGGNLNLKTTASSYRTRETTINDNVTVIHLPDYVQTQTFFPTVFIGAGIRPRITNKINLTIRSKYSFGLPTIRHEQSIYQHTITAQVGIQYSFSK